MNPGAGETVASSSLVSSAVTTIDRMVKIIKTLSNISALLLVAGSLILGASVPATAAPLNVPAGHSIQVKAAKTLQMGSVTSFHKTQKACQTQIQKNAKMVDNWSGYSVNFLNCYKESSTRWKGLVTYYYWSNS